MVCVCVFNLFVGDVHRCSWWNSVFVRWKNPVTKVPWSWNFHDRKWKTQTWKTRPLICLHKGPLKNPCFIGNLCDQGLEGSCISCPFWEGFVQHHPQKGIFSNDGSMRCIHLLLWCLRGRHSSYSSHTLGPGVASICVLTIFLGWGNLSSRLRSIRIHCLKLAAMKKIHLPGVSSQNEL